MAFSSGVMRYFYPRPPRGRRRENIQCEAKLLAISIHALREEGDQRQPCIVAKLLYFYPRPPRGGRRNGSWPNKASISYFYPRPPRGGRPASVLPWVHASRFLSTPSARRATCPLEPACADTCISIHALREEGDRNRCFRADRSADFYPRPPRGGRPVRFLLLHVQQDFYPRPPRGGRRVFLDEDQSDILISIHALREEGDRVRFLRSSQRHNFYPRPPRGGRRVM